MRLWREHLAKIAVAVVICVVSLTSAAMAARQAVLLEPLPAPAAPHAWAVAKSEQVGTVRPANIEGVLDADPFRFGVLHDAAPDSAAPADVADQQCRLLGTVVGLDGESFAMCEVGGVSRIVRQGQKVGTWTLLRVERAQVVFRDADGAAVTLKVAQPGGVAR